MNIKSIETILSASSTKNNNSSVPLILFSGGYDSTLLLLETLKTTNVETLYVEGWQHHHKSHMEQLYRRRIIDKINSEDRPYKIIADNTITSPVPNSLVTRHGGLFEGLTQPIEWLFGAFCAFYPQHHSKLLYGAIEGDSVLEQKEEILSIWSGLTSIRYRYFHYPLEIPFAHYSKQDVLSLLSNEYREYLSLIHTCETPSVSGATGGEFGDFWSDKRILSDCGKCLPCLTEQSMRRRLSFPPPNRKPHVISVKKLKAVETRWIRLDNTKINYDVRRKVFDIPSVTE